MMHVKFFPILGGILVAGGAMLAVGAFGEEKAPRKQADLSKEAIEVPTKAVLAITTAPTSGNPKVQPGLVKWHPSFAAACAAAKQSKKPVLLFQMMGKLDEQFC